MLENSMFSHAEMVLQNLAIYEIFERILGVCPWILEALGEKRNGKRA